MTGNRAPTAGRDTPTPPRILAGALRPYPEYKESGVEWLGHVPKHWNVMAGRACYSEMKESNKGLKETTVLSLSYGKIIVKSADKLHGLVPESFETYQIIEPDDIIIRPTDLQNDWNSLRFGLSHNRGIITSAYLCFRTKEPIDRNYGHLLLHTYDLKKVFYGLGSGLRQNLDWRDFKYLPCVVPPHSEQSAIVKFLENADRRIRHFIHAKSRLIDLLNEQKQAIIHNAVTRGIDPNVRLKPSGVEWLGDVPEHWNILPIKRAFVSMDYGISDPATDTGTIRILTMGNIKDGQVTIPESDGVASVDDSLLLKEGDLLFNRTNSPELVGKVGLFRKVDMAVTFASYLVRLRSRANYEPQYLNMILNDISILSLARREAIPSLHQSNLNPSRYGRLQISLPPLEEQQEILHFVEERICDLDRSITTAHREITLIREYQICFIADVVTGKVDVRGVEILDEEPIDIEGVSDTNALDDNNEDNKEDNNDNDNGDGDGDNDEEANDK